MRIGVLKERTPREQRVALGPEGAGRLVGAGHSVAVEAGSGTGSGFDDQAYVEAGAEVTDRAGVLASAELVLRVQVLGDDRADLTSELGSQHTVIGLADPLWNAEAVAALAESGATLLALELVPRITRAQSMDVLSSMATVAGYEAVLLAASAAPRMFPMLMTAAGTVPPTRVFVLGAGVAGLQAIATAKRLGAVVEAFDVRPAAVEQIRSVGARPIELDLDTGDSEDAGGYAKAQTDDQNARQQEQLTPVIAEADVVITTAAIPGRASPELITQPMVEAMASGAVIVDLAAERGGNCSLTVADEVVMHQGVAIHGPTDLVSHSPRNASQMLSNNLCTLIDHLTDDDGNLHLDVADEITGAMIVFSEGAVVHPGVREALGLDDRDATQESDTP